MLKHNYHTHTTRCNHATLTAEEQIRIAIEFGLETIGISEHSYSDTEGQWRLKDKLEFQEYVDEIKALKEKYKDKIRVLIGLESDVISLETGKSLFDDIIEISSNHDLDYQILGHHAYGAGKHIYAHNPTEIEMDFYLSMLEKVLATKKILYLAHPDGFVRGIGEWDQKAQDLAKKLIAICIKYEIPLGINFNGIYEKHYKVSYPNLEFFKLAASMGAKAVYELDTHSRMIWDEKLFLEAQEIVKKSGIKLIDKLI